LGSLRVDHGGRSLKQKTRRRPTTTRQPPDEKLKVARQFHRSSQDTQVMVSRNFDTTKLLQMWSQPLCVKQRESLSAQMLD
jgi:hypothetical protein